MAGTAAGSSRADRDTAGAPLGRSPPDRQVRITRTRARLAVDVWPWDTPIVRDGKPPRVSDRGRRLVYRPSRRPRLTRPQHLPKRGGPGNPSVRLLQILQL